MLVDVVVLLWFGFTGLLTWVYFVYWIMLFVWVCILFGLVWECGCLVLFADLWFIVFLCWLDVGFGLGWVMFVMVALDFIGVV